MEMLWTSFNVRVRWPVGPATHADTLMVIVALVVRSWPDCTELIVALVGMPAERAK